MQRDRDQELNDMGGIANQDVPENPYLGLPWEELLQRIRVADEATSTANGEIRATTQAVQAELAPWRGMVSAATEESRLLRAALKAQAIHNYQTHRLDIGKRWGGITLQFRPKVVIHDQEAAIAALSEFYLVDGETGEAIPLVTYTPVIDEKAVRAFIESQRGAHRNWPDAIHTTPAPHGWPGIITLQSEDDADAWVLAVSKHADGENTA
ncbi:hypothetical protein SE17_12250 [Kouleothrix aurantiaca]|uniref:Uncharacterized protein n=1 Tax=Kouleothrix aurantiaca TaxID=186479 RepID=A0A0P9DB58_9CHLR|nr:hypothetical protein SE17_12250 [Kouleothrix aurantiaca]